MNVADRHGYGSEMQQKAIMVGHSGEKKKKRNAPLCQNFRTAVITLLHPNQRKVTEILWHVKCQHIKYRDFNVTLFKKTGSINFQLHFQLVKSSRGNREKGASPWHRGSHFEVWNKTLFSEAVECTCNRFNLTAAAVSYLRFCVIYFSPWCWSSWKRRRCSPDLSQSDDLKALYPRTFIPTASNGWGRWVVTVLTQ